MATTIIDVPTDLLTAYLLHRETGVAFARVPSDFVHTGPMRATSVVRAIIHVLALEVRRWDAELAALLALDLEGRSTIMLAANREPLLAGVRRDGFKRDFARGLCCVGKVWGLATTHRLALAVVPKGSICLALHYKLRGAGCCAILRIPPFAFHHHSIRVVGGGSIVQHLRMLHTDLI
jgi:hypothetical protein